MSTSNRSDINEGADKKGHLDAVAGDKEDKKKRSKVPLTDGSTGAAVQPPKAEQEEAKQKTMSDSEKVLARRFKIYEASQKDVAYILSSWDRAQGILLSLLSHEEARHPAEDQHPPLSSRKSRKDREKERQERLEKERAERERLEKLKAIESRFSGPEREGADSSAKVQDVGVPCLDIQVLSAEDATGKILESGKLPTAEEVKPLGARVLRLGSGSWCFVSHQVTTAQSLVPGLFHHGSSAATWLGRFSMSLVWVERGSAPCSSILSVPRLSRSANH